MATSKKIEELRAKQVRLDRAINKAVNWFLATYCALLPLAAMRESAPRFFNVGMKVITVCFLITGGFWLVLFLRSLLIDEACQECRKQHNDCGDHVPKDHASIPGKEKQ